MNETPRLILFGRHACHLCDQMQIELQALTQGHPVRLDLRDIDERTEWRLEYGSRVPVLMTEAGEVLSEFQLDEARLREWLNQNSI